MFAGGHLAKAGSVAMQDSVRQLRSAQLLLAASEGTAQVSLGLGTPPARLAQKKLSWRCRPRLFLSEGGFEVLTLRAVAARV